MEWSGVAESPEEQARTRACVLSTPAAANVASSLGRSKTQGPSGVLLGVARVLPHRVPAAVLEPCSPCHALTLGTMWLLQLIAHDKEVYDIAWGGVGVFASVSADGSVRVFDLR